ESREHGGASRENDVVAEIFAKVDGGPLDAIEHESMDPRYIQIDHRRLEERLGASKSFGSDGHLLTIRQLVDLLEGRIHFGLLHLGVEIRCDVTAFLFDVLNDIFVLNDIQIVVTSLGQQLSQALGELSPRIIVSKDGCTHRIDSLDGNTLSDSLAD